MSGLCECGCGQRAPIATCTRAALGHVRGQPVRFVAGHNARRSAPTLAELRAQCVEEATGHDTPCWLWQGIVGVRGYAYRKVNGRRVVAHRLTYQAAHGPVPDGLQLDHLCRVRHCVNPAHLEPVRQAENIRRGSKTKLTADEVAAIRLSPLSCREIGRRYGIHGSHVSRIRSGKVWA